MLRGRLISILLGAALVLSATPALALLRSPRSRYRARRCSSCSHSFSQTINVNTAQVYAWSFAGIGVTQPAANFAARIELGEGELQLVNMSDPNLQKVTVLPSPVAAGWYSYVTFLNLGTMHVTLFDALNVPQGQTAYLMPVHALGFAVTDAHGTFYTFDYVNADGQPHLLAYEGTGRSAGDRVAGPRERWRRGLRRRRVLARRRMARAGAHARAGGR